MTRLIKGFSLQWRNQNFKFPSFTQVTWGPDSINTPSENKNPVMQIRFRKYELEKKNIIHSYGEMDRKIRNCEIFSIECNRLDGNT